MNILICDDMKRETDKLMKILCDCAPESTAVIFHSAVDSLAYIRSGAEIDCCFLDIVMPEMDGIALAETLRADGFKGDIIFLSTSREYGPEAYAVKAFGYLLKPPTQESVCNIMNDVKNARLSSKRDGIFVKTSNIMCFIPFSDISHVEVIKHNVYFRQVSGVEIESHTTFAEIAPRLLSDARFARCHRSFIINMDCIETVAGNEITMQCGASIPISRGFSEVKNEFMRWMFGEDGR